MARIAYREETMFYALALGSAAFYGAADFLGGLTSRRGNTLVIVLVSQGAGLLLMCVLLPLLPAAVPEPSDWVLGSVSGLAGGIGVALLYRALAVGTMAVVAPITAVCAVVVPVVLAIALGERPGVKATAGIALAIVAIALVSQAPSPDVQRSTANPRRGVGLALASGVAIGFVFIALGRTNAEAGLWPLLAARLTLVGLFAVFAIFYRSSFNMPASVMATVIVGGLLDMLANLLYLLAAQSGPLTIV